MSRTTFVLANLIIVLITTAVVEAIQYRRRRAVVAFSFVNLGLLALAVPLWELTD